eukprot:SAG31_NODE_8_length_42345_cov_10.980992_13_plen_131_part_00
MQTWDENRYKLAIDDELLRLQAIVERQRLGNLDPLDLGTELVETTQPTGSQPSLVESSASITPSTSPPVEEVGQTEMEENRHANDDVISFAVVDAVAAESHKNPAGKFPIVLCFSHVACNIFFFCSGCLA